MSSTTARRGGAARAPALLTDASYYGTLAAARCLGRAGIPVTVADADPLAPARWSRYVTRRERCPAIGVDPEGFVAWLVAFGAATPGHVLYPTSDAAAWVLSEHRERLARHFHMFQPPLAVLRRLLDKRELFAACAEVGIDAPVTHFPRDEAEAVALAERVGFPLLLKPTMQVLSRSQTKGMTAGGPDALVERYRAFCAGNAYHPTLSAQVAGVEQPIMQAYHPAAARGMYSIAGFADGARGAHEVTALAATKVLQRPRKLGIGLCFEEAPVRPALRDALAALCQRVGYAGVFEAEFIEEDGRFLLVDFNPRFYSQMAFEVDRGLPLPLIAYEAALGRHDALAAARHALADAPAVRRPRVYTHRLLLGLMTSAQQLSGRMGADEAAGWRRWYRAHRGRVSDAVRDRRDRGPAVADTARTALHYGRHPRAFVRSIVLDR
jgi:predicted ATP-grasp superfamily ATP-dependent carboligase